MFLRASRFLGYAAKNACSTYKETELLYSAVCSQFFERIRPVFACLNAFRRHHTPQIRANRDRHLDRWGYREVRIAVVDRVQTIAISDIVRIDFGDSASTSPPSPSSEPVVPTKLDMINKQAKFCDVIAAYRTDAMRVANEPNPIVRAGLHKPEPAEYDGRLAAILGTSGEFDSWHGTVRFHVTGQWVDLEFTPDCKPPQAVAFATANSAQMRDGAQTLILLNSPLARTLSRLKSNDSVLASGRLLYAARKSTYRGSPDNPNPSVAAPRYLAQFNSVTVNSR